MPFHRTLVHVIATRITHILKLSWSFVHLCIVHGLRLKKTFTSFMQSEHVLHMQLPNLITRTLRSSRVGRMWKVALHHQTCFVLLSLIIITRVREWTYSLWGSPQSSPTHYVCKFYLAGLMSDTVLAAKLLKLIIAYFVLLLDNFRLMDFLSLVSDQPTMTGLNLNF